MNKKQKYVLKAAFSIILLSVIVWVLFGLEIFTKTQVLVEKRDELFGWSEKIWVDKFVWGLDLTLLIIGFTVVISGALLYFFRSKRKNK